MSSRACSQQRRCSPWIACSGAFLLAVSARLAYLLILKPDHAEDPYWLLASGLLHDGSWTIGGIETTAFEPLYPLFIAAGRLLTGDRVVWVQALQGVASSIGAIALYRLAFALTNRRRIAVVSALLYAIDPLLVRHGVRASEQWLVSIFLIAFASAFLKAQDSAQQHKPAALAGFWLGLAVLTRSAVLPLTVLAAIVLVRQGRRRAALALALVSLVTWSPMAIRNYMTNGSFLPTRGGLNLFIGNSRYAAFLMPTVDLDTLAPYTDALLAIRRPELLTFDVDMEDDLDAFWTREAWTEMKRDPWALLALKARYVMYVFWPRAVPARLGTADTTFAVQDDRYIVQNTAARPLLDELVYSTFFSIVLLASLLGVYVRRHVLGRDLVLWCILGSAVLVQVVYFPATRYRTPVEFVLLFYAAVAIDHAVTRWRLTS